MIVDLIPKGTKNRPGGKNSMRYITLHDTGNSARGANALNHAKYLKGGPNVSWHYTVDDTRVVQHLPDSETAWHTGTNKGNTTSIGIEVCINSDGNLSAAYDRAARLCADLCRTHGIPVANIVQHNFWNGKDCPKTMRAGKPYSFATFLTRVKQYLEENTMDKNTPSPWAKALWEQAKALGITDGSRPHDLATREEVIAMLMRLKK